MARGSMESGQAPIGSRRGVHCGRVVTIAKDGVSLTNRSLDGGTLTALLKAPVAINSRFDRR